MTTNPPGQYRFKTFILLAGISILIVLALLPISEDLGQQQIDEAFARALVGFAVARGLNGVISVAQGTEVAIQPAGVGLNFTPGEILDPVNDLVERFSWIMMLASSSLGVQKVLLSMSAWQGLAISVAVLGALLMALLLFEKRAPQSALFEPWVAAALLRLFLFVMVLRFMMPAVIIANNWVYETFLQQDYAEATQSLEQARQAIGEINAEVRAESQIDESSSLLEITENTIRLVVVFLMQTLVFPLLFLYIVYGLIKRLTKWPN